MRCLLLKIGHRVRPRVDLMLALLALTALPLIAQETGSGGVNRPEHRDKPYVILISLDGFKPEYLDRFELPTMRRIAHRGARAKGMRPVFPSLTFPNHYSLVTGLYPANHGIVSNRFFDPELNDTYVYNDNSIVSQGKWYGGEPVWVTAETQGMVAACYFWPGSEAPIKGVRPTTYLSYSSNVANQERVKTVLEWLRLPLEKRPHMMTLYFSEMDSTSHGGPLDSPEVEKSAQSLDTALGLLVNGIDLLDIRDRVYLILTSDHGMVETSDKQSVQLASILEPDDIAQLTAAFSGPVVNLHLKADRNTTRLLRDKINSKLEQGRAYLRADLPQRFRYRTNPRSGDIVIVMNEGWGMSVPRVGPEPPRSQALPGSESRPDRARPERWGSHGWDPDLPSMQALFMVSGPRIRPGHVVDRVENVDVYPFITEILGLKPASPIDGRPGRLRRLVVE